MCLHVPLFYPGTPFERFAPASEPSPELLWHVLNMNEKRHNVKLVKHKVGLQGGDLPAAGCKPD